MVDQTSLSLLNALQQSPSDETWRRFLEIYIPLMESWLRRQGAPQDIVEDVRQEVLLKVHQEIGSFAHNGRPGAFRCWMRNLVSHRLRTILRQRWKDPAGNDFIMQELAEQLGQDDSGLARLWDEEHDAHLADQLLQLVAPRFNEKSMLAFRSVVLGRKEPSEVAAQLGMSVNAVRIAQTRVLAALREVGAGLLDV
jgi:RNA polymerase sigma-70 factor (ECF subfamily)